jgi:hypothetical protein
MTNDGRPLNAERHAELAAAVFKDRPKPSGTKQYKRFKIQNI